MPSIVAASLSLAHEIPLPAKEASFRWLVQPPGDILIGKVYTDGSFLDRPGKRRGRAG